MVVAMSAFPALLMGYRTRLGISRNKLARKVGVDPSYLSRIEHGLRQPPREYIVKAIISALKLTPYEQDALLMAGGYAPTSINGSGWSPAMHAVSLVLNNHSLTNEQRASFEDVILAIAQNWGVAEVENVTVD